MKTSNLADIDVVGLPIAVAIAGKFGVVDCYGARGIGRAEYSLLIIVEVGVGDREIARLIPNSRAVVIGDLGARELDVVESYVGVGNEEGLAIADEAAAHEMGHAAHADNVDLFVYDGAVIHISTGANVDGVSIMRGGDCRMYGFKLLSSTNGESGSRGFDGSTAYCQGRDTSGYCATEVCWHDGHSPDE